MPLNLSARETQYERNLKIRAYSGVLVGAYTVGGDPIDFTNISNANFLGDVFPGAIPDPLNCFVLQMPAGYSAQVVVNPAAPATPTLQNALALKVFSAAGVELAAAAYPAALLAGTLVIEVRGSRWSS